MKHENRNMMFITLCIVALMITTLLQAVYGEQLFLRSIVSITIQLSLASLGVVRSIELQKGLGIIERANAPIKTVFWAKESAVIAYISFSLFSVAATYATNGDLTGLLIEAAPLPYIIGTLMLIRHTVCANRMIKRAGYIAFIVFSALYIALLCFAGNENLRLIAIFAFEVLALLLYIVSLRISYKRSVIEQRY